MLITLNRLLIPKDLCNFMSYPKLKKRLKKHGLNMRLNELRDYFATFMVRYWDDEEVVNPDAVCVGCVLGCLVS